MRQLPADIIHNYRVVDSVAAHLYPVSVADAARGDEVAARQLRQFRRRGSSVIAEATAILMAADMELDIDTNYGIRREE